MCLTTELQQQIKKHQLATGETSALVIVENSDNSVGLHHIAFDPYMGLMVDGSPPPLRWYQLADTARLVESSPNVLH